ncbi:hypothetical protein [Streptomyces chartreusis]|uniref:hypothetical protein n=1 Tax=Streptomyces chartreusis TaxID=1969 RepID=UPI003826F7EC
MDSNHGDTPTDDDPDDIVTEVTETEWHDAASKALARLGLTYAELEDQARRRDFTSAQAQVLWVSIGGTITTELLGEQAAPVTAGRRTGEGPRMSSAQAWAERIQAVVREANDDGFEMWVDDEFEGERLEVRIGSTRGTDDALVMEWNA